MKIENLKELKQNLKNILNSLDKNIDSLYELATRDEKTKLYNYKFFKNILEIEFEKARRGSPLSLAILDIDDFKQVNTKYGHIKADQFLVKTARTIEKSLRKSDIVARFGGEEFIILFSNTNVNKAEKISERIRKKIEANSKPKINVSIGLTEYKEKDTIMKLKSRADSALYKAKSTGKNKVVTN